MKAENSVINYMKTINNNKINQIINSHGLQMAPAMPALKYITLVDIQKTRYKKLVTHVDPHASAVSLLKRAENSVM